MEQKYNIFVCYSRKDLDIVRFYYHDLQMAGLKLWFDMDCVMPGDSFENRMVEAISNCSVFLFFHSQNANESHWMEREVHFAKKKGLKIVPVKLDKSDYTESLKVILDDILYINHSVNNYKESIKELISILGGNQMNEGVLNKKYDVFISCKSEDYPHAEKVSTYLRKHDITPFLASESLRRVGNTAYLDEIDKALEECQHLIVFCTRPEYADSKFVKEEWQSFRNEKLSGRKDGNILTVAADSISIGSLPYGLRRYEVIRMSEYEQVLLNYLVEAINKYSNARKENKQDKSAETANQFELTHNTKRQIVPQKSPMPFHDSGVDMPLKAKKISIIGVGGGGCNAVNYMYCNGLNDVNFYVCNSDFSALDCSPIPSRIKLGKDGIGCSNRPERGLESASYSLDSLKHLFSDDSDIVIVVTCLGGGTGTGATPLIAQTAKRLGKFVIGVATIPYRFEGTKKVKQAIDGVQTLKDATDSLILIPLEKLRKLHTEMTIRSAFNIADQVIKNITENLKISITTKGLIDLNQKDFIDSFKSGGLVNCVFTESDGSDRISSAFTRLKQSQLFLHDDYERAYVVIKYPHKHPLTIDEYQYLSNPSTWGDYKDVMKLGVYEDFSEDSKLSMHFYQINGNTERTLKTLI